MKIPKLFKFGGNRSKSPQAKSSKSSGRVLPEDKDVIMKIVNGFKDRSRKDIDKWRSAILLTELPEKPRFNPLHDLYNDLMTDGHLKAQIRLRKSSILNTEFSIIDKTSDKINEEATEFFNQKWFYDLLSHSLDSSLLGHTLIEFKSFLPEKVELDIVPRRNVVPQEKKVIPDLTKTDYIKYDDPFYENWLIEIGSHKDLGLINDIIPNLIWKRNVAQSWAEFCEKFGMPMVTATSNSTNTKELDKIEFMLQQIGEASTGVFPQGTTVDIKQISETDAYQTYSKFISFNREEISVVIVGGTMITNDGSSRSQSEVHERNLDEKIAIDEKRNLGFIVNDSLLPLLRNQGYSFIKENDKFHFNKSHNLGLDKFWKIVNGVMGTYEIDQDWLSEVFHIPIVGKKKIQQLPSISKVAALGVNFPNYPKACCDYTKFAAIASKSNNIIKIQEDLAQEVWENAESLGTQARLVAEEALHLLDGLIKGWGKQRIEASWNQPDHLLLQFMEQNLFHFAASKTEARLAAMKELILNPGEGTFNTFSEFKSEALKVTEAINNSYLSTEYNNTVSTGQNSAAYIRFKAEEKTVTPFVQYQTAGDDKVRSEHQLLDGKVFRLSDPEAMRLNPPNDHNCRCEFVQYFGDESNVVSGKSALKLLGKRFAESEFNQNRAVTKQVFTKKQFYTDNGELINDVAKIDFRDYSELVPVSEIKGLGKLKLDKTITAKNVTELFKTNGKISGKDFMGYTDHLLRKIVLPKSTFKKFTAKVEQRQLFPQVKNAVEKADEVWMIPSKDSFEMNYLKFYSDEVVVVRTAPGTEAVEIKEWKIIRGKEEEVRKGVLIKQSK